MSESEVGRRRVLEPSEVSAASVMGHRLPGGWGFPLRPPLKASRARSEHVGGDDRPALPMWVNRPGFLGDSQKERNSETWAGTPTNFVNAA